jgi:choline-glycine betaine transporter
MIGKGRRIGREVLIHLLILVASWHLVFAVLAVGAIKGADGGPADIWGLYRTYAPAMWGAPGGEMVALVKQVAIALFGIVAIARWMILRQQASHGSGSSA